MPERTIAEIRQQFDTFREDPKLLVGTRWLGMFTELEGGIYRCPHRYGDVHQVEVLAVTNGRAHIATTHSVPFEHGHVPVADMLCERSAFYYLGQREDLEWIGHNAVLVYDPQGEDRRTAGPWVVESYTGATVFFYSRADIGFGHNASWASIVSDHRRATPEERHYARLAQRRMIADPNQVFVAPDQGDRHEVSVTEVPDVPDEVPSVTSSGRSALDRIATEEVLG